MEFKEDFLEEAMEGALGLKSGTASTIAHFAGRPWVNHSLFSRISFLLLKIRSSKITYKILFIVITIAPFIKCLP